MTGYCNEADITASTHVPVNPWMTTGDILTDIPVERTDMVSQAY